jgi:hypothetical protein
MEVSKMQAELYCVNCKKDTLHEVVYIGENIKKIKCLECEVFLEVDDEMILSTFAKDIFQRVSTKPQRMSKEIRNDLSKFLCSIPFRVATKPYRMIKEFKEIKNINKN